MTRIFAAIRIWHRAFTWPERLTILVLVGIAIAKAALVAGD